MIRAKVYCENNQAVALEVQGHADYEQYGKDIVCASVSSILTGGFNSFSDYEIEEIKLEEGYAYIAVKNENDALIKLEVIITQLRTIQEAYPNYISINENERRCKK